MGTGSRVYRATRGQSQAQLEHERALIPVYEQRAAAELGVRKLAFEQELKQAEAMNLLAQKFSGRQQQPVFAPPPVAAGQGEQPNYTLLIILGIVAVLFFKKGKLL